MSRRGVALVGAALAVAMALPACQGHTSAAVPSTSGKASTTVAAGNGRASEPAATVYRRAVSVARGALVVRTGPGSNTAVLTTLPQRTATHSPRVLLVRQVRHEWVEVALPVRPNGSTGWVAASDVRVEPVRVRITISLSARRLTLSMPGSPDRSVTVSVGSPANPTPTGTFFVTDRVRPDDPNGAYGAFALGLSAHSDTLSEFGSGDGQVGIHGTNDRAGLGRAVSHGCIRVPDEMTARLALVPLGAPVMITA